VSFSVGADEYDRFMGRYSVPLAPRFATLAQLVVHFMADPAAGLREMARVTRAGGVVAACVWDHAGGRGPLSVFWAAARGLDPDVDDESGLAGARQGDLARRLAGAGISDIEEAMISVDVAHPTFEEWWQPFLAGFGPSGRYVARLGPSERIRLREACRQLLPDAPFVISAGAWAARGRV
jgi:SAM-dependent methyltransferase